MAVVEGQTPVRPVSNTIGGITFDDPFQWLETEDQEALDWEQAQDDAARGHLHATRAWRPMRAAAARTHEELFSFWAPQRFGDRWWHQHVPPGSSLPVISVSETATDR